MLVRNSFTTWFALALVVLSAYLPVKADSDRMMLTRTADAVVVSGEKLSVLRNRAIAGIRIFALKDDDFIPVPFQIDQRNSTGNWVWDLVVKRRGDLVFDDDFESEMPSDFGVGNFQLQDDEDPPEEARLDNNDMLVFLARDTGMRVDVEAKLHDANVVVEIEVLDPVNGTNGWVYAAYFEHKPPAYSSVRYMSHSARTRRIRTPVYQFKYSGSCIVCIEDLRIQNAPLVDRINIRGRVRVDLGFMRRDIGFAETDIHGYVEGIIEGPVRMVKRHVVHLELWHLIRTADVTCDHFYYPDYAEIPICLPVRFPITEASVFLLTELHKTALRRTLIGGGEGNITEYSKGVRNLDAGHDLHLDWIAFDSPHGSVVSFVELPEKIAAYAQARPCLCDEAVGTMDAEISAVAGPVAGFVVKSGEDCPKGPHVLHGTYVISPHPYQIGDEMRAHHLAHTGLVTYVTNIEISR